MKMIRRRIGEETRYKKATRWNHQQQIKQEDDSTGCVRAEKGFWNARWRAFPGNQGNGFSTAPCTNRNRKTPTVNFEKSLRSE
jgi:hypothetical protein